MDQNPLDAVPAYNRLSLRAVITRAGEDPSAALAAAGIVDPISLPIAMTSSADEAAHLLGAGAMPHLAAVWECIYGINDPLTATDPAVPNPSSLTASFSTTAGLHSASVNHSQYGVSTHAPQNAVSASNWRDRISAYCNGDSPNLTVPPGVCAGSQCGMADLGSQLITSPTTAELPESTAQSTTTALAQVVGSNASGPQRARPHSGQQIRMSSRVALPRAGDQQIAAANTGVQSDATTAPAQPVNYYTSTLNNSTASALGMNRNQLRAAIHALKAAAGLRGDDNVQILVPSGEVFFNGKSIGNLNDE